VKFGVVGRLGDEEKGNAEASLARLAGAEAQGFDAVWVAAEDVAGGAAGRSLFAAAQLAERTQEIEIGLWSVLDPGLHPLRLAEDLAVLDIVSGGRLHWAPTGPDLAEPLEIILKAWSGEPFAHEGPRFEFPSLVCLPVPEQKPHPRLWFSRSEREEAALKQADQDRCGWLIASDRESESPSDAGARALIFRMPAGLRGEFARIREEVESLERRYSPDLLLLWPGPEVLGSRDAEALQNDFATACLESRP
jgi:alkanesulfonate monooxygenase SsuD/methylene tetrahydromethanopterin reductase-like flavin-dependent oxidoreductase (luciferase family)